MKIIKSGRLFTFGCSFTRYHWATWADIMAQEYDFYENWGNTGGGNQFIFNSLIECHQRHHFTSSDTVVIMWTNISREDRYVRRSWLLPGNIYSQNTYSPEFVKQFADTRGYLIRDLATITAAKDLLDLWQVNYEFLSMVPVDAADQYSPNRAIAPDVLELYSGTLQKIKPSIYETVFDFDWLRKFTPEEQAAYRDPARSGPDPHPRPRDYLEYLGQVLPEFAISPELRIWTEQQQRNVSEKIYYNRVALKRL